MPFLYGVHLIPSELKLLLDDVHFSKRGYPVLAFSIGTKLSTERSGAVSPLARPDFLRPRMRDA
jgi:hypothetical protein